MKGDGFIGTPQIRARVEAEVRRAVRLYVDDPLDPPASESVNALTAALEDLLYVAWPAGEDASPDGVRLALIHRADDRVTLTGCVVMLYGGPRTSHRLRPLAAEFAPDGEGTIRVASRREEIDFKKSAELKFADPNAVQRWDRTIRLGREPRFPCPCCGYRTLPEPSPSDEICPVCTWQDDYVDNQDTDVLGPNHVTLSQARANFAAQGVSEPGRPPSGRPPRSDEMPPTPWTQVPGEESQPD